MHGGIDDDTLYGDKGNDLIASTMAMICRWRHGNDVIYAGAGDTDDDAIHGGANNDTIAAVEDYGKLTRPLPAH